MSKTRDTGYLNNIIQYSSSSVSFVSGSTTLSSINTSGNTKYGINISSTHQFTGSIYTSGSVQSNNTLDNYAFKISPNGADLWGMYANSSSSFSIRKIGTADYLTVTSTGNVGINTINSNRPLEIASSTGIPTLRINNTAAGGNAGIEILTSPTKVSWLIGAQYNVDSALEITPSTANGGTTFTTPALTIKSTGIKLSGGSSYLNYYEEGTWTPAFTNSSTTPSYITQFGRYTRIGRLVHIVGKISASNLSGGAAIIVDGLPFSAADASDSGQRVSIRPEGDWGGFVNTSQFSSTMFRINGSNFQGVKDGGSGGSAYATYSSYGTTLTFNFNATYYV